MTTQIVYYNDGTKEYYIEGQLHRLDGPAVEWVDGRKHYWVNDICVTDKVKDISEEDIPKYLRMLAL